MYFLNEDSCRNKSPLIVKQFHCILQGWNDLNQLIKISDLNHEFD